MTPQTATEPSATGTKRRVIRYRAVPIRHATPAPKRVATESAELSALRANQKLADYFMSREPKPDPEIWASVMKNIQEARDRMDAEEAALDAENDAKEVIL